MFERFRHRSNDLEHIDIGDYTPEEYEGCILELQRVNKWLGDARALRLSLLAAVKQACPSSFSVLDVGSGSGELLRVVADWARQNKRNSNCVGLELNARSAEAILEHSRDFPEISAVRGDAFRLPFTDGTFDYVICTLTMHHFGDQQVVLVLKELDRVARRQTIVIDLHRHPVAYYFYTTVGRLFLHTRLLREDGALSILRSFKPDELLKLAQMAELEDIQVVRRFPYRLVLSARKSESRTGSESPAAEERPLQDDRMRLAS